MLLEKLEKSFFRGAAQGRIHTIKPVAFSSAQELVREVYEQMDRDFDLVPPVTVHSPIPKLLAGVWMMTREAVVAGEVSRVEREAVCAGISKLNTCPICWDERTSLLVIR